LVRAVGVDHPDLSARLVHDLLAVRGPSRPELVAVGGQEPLPGSVDVHDHDPVPPRGFEGHEDDPRAVWGPRRPVRLLTGHAAGAAHVGAVGAHRVDLEAAGTVGSERDPLPVRRPGRILVGGDGVGQAFLARPIGRHDVDLVVAVPGREESDARAGRRGGRVRAGRRGPFGRARRRRAATPCRY
jgi:hypothetical protein